MNNKSGILLGTIDFGNESLTISEQEIEAKKYVFNLKIG